MVRDLHIHRHHISKYGVFDLITEFSRSTLQTKLLLTISMHEVTVVPKPVELALVNFLSTQEGSVIDPEAFID